MRLAAALVVLCCAVSGRAEPPQRVHIAELARRAADLKNYKQFCGLHELIRCETRRAA